MKIFSYGKDGGALSKVWGLFITEIKKAFSIVLLRFENGSREAYHSHAFNAVSWILKGKLVEYVDGAVFEVYRPSLTPIWTPRDRFHKVYSVGTTWVISFRGPWADTWKEYTDKDGEITLTHGRRPI